LCVGPKKHNLFHWKNTITEGCGFTKERGSGWGGKRKKGKVNGAFELWISQKRGGGGEGQSGKEKGERTKKKREEEGRKTHQRLPES